MDSRSVARCPECGGARERDHCVEPGKRVGRIGCGWWKLADVEPVAYDYDRPMINWWAENYWRQIRRLHKAYANLGCVDEFGSAMHYTGEVGPKECTCQFCVDGYGR